MLLFFYPFKVVLPATDAINYAVYIMYMYLITMCLLEWDINQSNSLHTKRIKASWYCNHFNDDSTYKHSLPEYFINWQLLFLFAEVDETIEMNLIV